MFEALALAVLLAATDAPVEPTPPIGPKAPTVEVPKLALDKMAEAPKEKAPAARAAAAGGPEKAAAKDGPADQRKPTPAEVEAASALEPKKAPPPPSLSAQALCAEFVKSTKGHAAARAQLDAQKRTLEKERDRLERMAADIDTARAALRQETAKLEALLAERSNPGSSAALASTTQVARGAAKSKAGATQADQVTDLAKMVKAMRPEQAATLISKLDTALSASVLKRMRPAEAGAVLGRLKPDVAADLVSLMARPGGAR